MAADKIADVFKTTGQPTITYVKRDSGKLENQLSAALDERGQLCLVTGPSKTGKTTLYNEVLRRRGEVPLVVRCDRSKSADSLWRAALEAVDFDRVASRETATEKTLELEAEAGGTLGWSWLAGMTAKFRGMFSHSASENEVRSKILADPGPDLIIPLLRETNYTLVIEDFHYLEDSEKIILFQQWKAFVDSDVTIVVLGTTHRAVDIANSNADLVGRVAQIDVGHWDTSDLKKIADQGFKYLGVNLPGRLNDLIAEEAVGLPIIVQQACYEIFTSRGLAVKDVVPKNMRVTRENVERSFHGVANGKYSQYGSYYSTIISGPREKARKYRTYELILTCFTLDPIKFALKRMEIDERLSRLEVEKSEIPPAASINSTLGALKNFQQRRNLRLLEWLPSEDKLYIIEPAFLFYVRWRQIKDTQPAQLDLFEMLVRSVADRKI